jgi:ABC-type oligopeptide transport system substrate-binding subunit
VKIKTIVGAALAGGIAVTAFAIAAPSAEADLNATEGGNQVVACTGGEYIASLNPTIKDGNAVDGFAARYTKAVVKLSDGTKTLFGNPLPADNTACAIDAGIRTDQGYQDVKYLLDN